MREFMSAFVVLLAICDVPGNIPIVLNIQNKGIHISARRAFLYALIMMVSFFYAGEAFLNLFGVDISSFAIAGSLIIFLISLEMILDINLFCEGTEISNDATLVPVVFPLFIGAGVLTALLSLRSQYQDINILLAVLANCAAIYVTIRLSRILKRFLSPASMYVLKKFFGMVLLAISVKLFITNLTVLLASVQG
ncbi:MAG: MarC family protein [Alphaproteobacteria bacterium]|nr:MarC family protein [Alphaproteobacteria bacterium]